MNIRSIIGLAALLGLVASGATRAGEENSASTNAAFDRCAKLLNYGEVFRLNEPNKIDAVHALGLLGDPRAVPLLMDHLENAGNQQLRMETARALGWIGDQRAVPALERALLDPYPYVRVQAANALRKITGKEYRFDHTGLPDPDALRRRLEERMRAAGGEN